MSKQPTPASAAVVEFARDGGKDGLTSTQKKIKKKEAKNKKSGGFQSMGLTPPVFNAIKQLGYKLPTPVQRKAIPEILAGHDLVAMARTGSGKTAAFLIPIVERLQAHSPSVGVRAVILSPTRELAMQTHKFAKQLVKLTDLRTCLLVGGASMEGQFEKLSNNPDIIIATPGRLMHHLVEVQMSLKSVEFAVFDEADRLFEMGFAAQLREIMKAMEGSNARRQTLLFSATMPSVLVEFARAGLREPKIVRLDVETKISPLLKISFLTVRKDEKPAALLYLLKKIIPTNQQTLVFASTRHHVEFLSSLLTRAGIDNAPVYGTMDATARKLNVSKFRARKAKVLVVTDIAARGIDIPMLDNVVNYDMASKAKLFIHRVGRVARAGRSGCSYSFVAPDEVAYMVDLHLFLGRKLLNVAPTVSVDHSEPWNDTAAPSTEEEKVVPESKVVAKPNGNAKGKPNKAKPSASAPAAAPAASGKKRKGDSAGGDDIYAAANEQLVQDALTELMRDFAPSKVEAGQGESKVELTDDVYYGSFPRGVLEDELTYVSTLLQTDMELETQFEVSKRAYKLYATTRPGASSSSVRRAKQISSSDVHPHPMFGKGRNEQDELGQLLRSISTFKPRTTIFEIAERKNDVMRVKRAEHDKVIKRALDLAAMADRSAATAAESDGVDDKNDSGGDEVDGDAVDDDDDEGDEPDQPAAGKRAVPIKSPAKGSGGKRKAAAAVAEGASSAAGTSAEPSRKRKKTAIGPGAYRDDRFYIRSTPTPEVMQRQKDDQGYAVHDRDSLHLLGGGLDTMVLDVTADETDALRKQQQQKLWDRKKKKFVVVGRDQGIKVRNESGKIVRSGGDKVKKTDLYEQWKKKKRKVIPTGGAEDTGVDGDDFEAAGKRSRSSDAAEEDGEEGPRKRVKSSPASRGGRGRGGRVPNAGAKRELRSPDEIRKERTQKSFKAAQHNRGGGSGGSRGGRGGFGGSRGGSRGGGGGSRGGGGGSRGGGGRGRGGRGRR